jgi:hypothetical protein
MKGTRRGGRSLSLRERAGERGKWLKQAIFCYPFLDKSLKIWYFTLLKKCLMFQFDIQKSPP